MLRRISTAALTGISSACARALPSALSTESNGAVSRLVGAAAVTGSKNGCCAEGSFCTSKRFYLHTSRVARDDTAQQTPPSSDSSAAGPAAAPPSSGASGNESALDVAMRVNKLKKLHQTGGAGTNKKEVEQQAWQALNSLTENQINNAEGKAVSLLLNSWAYFAKFWAKGKDGPL